MLLKPLTMKHAHVLVQRARPRHKVVDHTSSHTMPAPAWAPGANHWTTGHKISAKDAQAARALKRGLVILSEPAASSLPPRSDGGLGDTQSREAFQHRRMLEAITI